MSKRLELAPKALIDALERRAAKEHAKAWPPNDSRAQIYAPHVRPKKGETWTAFVRRELVTIGGRWQEKANLVLHKYLEAIVEARKLGLVLPGRPDDDEVNEHLDEHGAIAWVPAYAWSETTTAATQVLDRVILHFGSMYDGPFWEGIPHPHDRHLALLAALASPSMLDPEAELLHSLPKLTNTIGRRRKRQKDHQS